MDDVAEFFTKLFQTDDFPARWHCGNWSPFLGWLYISSDAAIWLAYFIIPFRRSRLKTPLVRATAKPRISGRRTGPRSCEMTSLLSALRHRDT
jgi:hypothetical protein